MDKHVTHSVFFIQLHFENIGEAFALKTRGQVGLAVAVRKKSRLSQRLGLSA